MKSNKKEILMTTNTVLIDIQKAFTAFFPFLKIDFLQPDIFFRSLRTAMVDPLTSIKNLSKSNTIKKINVDDDRTVSEVSNDFKNALGFAVQVSRKSGNVWNVISVTDGWTLESQNSAGKYISSVMSIPLNKN